MRTTNSLGTFRIFTAVSVVALCACHTLSSPVSDDGADSGNPNGAVSNTVGILSITADSSSFAVGHGSRIYLFWNGQPFPFDQSLVTYTVSDSTVLGCCVGGSSVGTATLTAAYGGATATIGFGVVQNAAGAVARFVDAVNHSNGNAPQWGPDSIAVPTGSIVEFGLSGASHNVVFDSVPGAPANVPTTPDSAASWHLVPRTFATAGLYHFRCTTHGESGVVLVSQ